MEIYLTCVMLTIFEIIVQYALEIWQYIFLILIYTYIYYDHYIPSNSVDQGFSPVSFPYVQLSSVFSFSKIEQCPVCLDQISWLKTKLYNSDPVWFQKEPEL